MRLDVLDADTLARVGWVDVWVSLYWDSPYYSEGGFTLEVRPTTENLQLLQEGRWVVRSDETPRIPMRICSRANQNEDANLVVSGYPATWLLTKRVSAAVLKEQNAEQAMRSLVSAMQPWPRLELGTEYGFDTTFDKQTSGGTVFDYCQTIGQACDLGFRIVLDGKGSKKKLLFECFRPTFDPNRRYSPQWGNLLNAGWSFADTDYANVALVQGAGEGDERATVWVGDVNATGEVHTIGKPTDPRYVKAVVSGGEIRCINLLDSYHISGVIKNYIMNRFTGNKAPLPAALRGLLAREGFTDEFLTLFEGGEQA